MNETEKAVSQYLMSQNVNFNAVLLGERKRDGWKCDAWAVSFRHGEKVADFEYFTGTGHRKAKKPMPHDIARLSPNKLARSRWEAEYVKPVTPPSAAVLYCLLSDMSASGQTFASWCGEFGLDTDSRKVLATYEQCQHTADKMHALFSREQLATLNNILEDY